MAYFLVGLIRAVLADTAIRHVGREDQVKAFDYGNPMVDVEAVELSSWDPLDFARILPGHHHAFVSISSSTSVLASIT